MEGRYPTGLLFVITNCSDPSKEEEFNYWYNHIHLPDVTSSGAFQHAIRFANTEPDAADGKYIATYETFQDDVPKAWSVLQEHTTRLREQGRSFPALKLVTAGVFKKLGGEFCGANRPTRGILAVLSNCNDPAREDECNRWYNDVHLPDILDSGLYNTAYRYEALDPQATGAKYLAIYETHLSDPGKAGSELRKLRANWEERERMCGLIDVSRRMTARRTWPMD